MQNFALQAGTYEVVDGGGGVIALIEIASSGRTSSLPIGVVLPRWGNPMRVFQASEAIAIDRGGFWFPIDGDGDQGLAFIGDRVEGSWFADRTGVRGELKLRPTSLGRDGIERVVKAGGAYPLDVSSDSSGTFAYGLGDFTMNLLISDEGSELEVRADSTVHCPPTSILEQLCAEAARDEAVIVYLPSTMRYPADLVPEWSTHTAIIETLSVRLDPGRQEVRVTFGRQGTDAAYTLPMMRVRQPR